MSEQLCRTVVELESGGCADVGHQDAEAAGQSGDPEQLAYGQFPIPGEDGRRIASRAAMAVGLANVYHDSERRTVTLLLDEVHATAVVYAIRVLAAEYEAHAREVRAVASTMPSDSYGATNRWVIATRYERVAARLRRVESGYRIEVSEGDSPLE